jgi:secreted trypsin-like serine protease
VKRALLIPFLAAAAALTALPVSAITRGGQPDAGEHPYVGLMIAKDADDNPLWRCSGTLISATVFVTAGHCTESPAASATIWFDEEVLRGGTPPEDSYPFGGPGTFDGTTHVHPNYDPNGFYLYDLGVVELDGEGAAMDEYGALPAVGAVDELANGRKQAVVEAVGYGLQLSNPVRVEDELVRRKADLFVVNTTGVAGIGNLDTGDLPPTNSMVLSGDAKNGGTCFGDSGGPIFLGTDSNVLAAVTSFGLNGNCAGVGGVFRIDRQVELDWINSFTTAPTS